MIHFRDKKYQVNQVQRPTKVIAKLLIRLSQSEKPSLGPYCAILTILLSTYLFIIILYLYYKLSGTFITKLEINRLSAT